MADTTYQRKSPFGIALLVVGVLVILLIVFLMMNRGGEVTSDVGADGVNPVPEQIEPSEAGVPIDDEAEPFDDDFQSDDASETGAPIVD